ncbi:MAG: prolipoprotein diacylglyceryl transferase [Eubacteriales bacterium]|nr:prolipoprotein diacylglyceryl transferase [Eubacteriales bacterium]
MHQYFDLGFITLPAMGVCILVGTLFALITLFTVRRLTDLSTDDVLDGVLWAVILGFVGMKILFWIVEPDALTLSFDSWSSFWISLKSLVGEGMVFYGGLIGGLIGVMIVCLRKKKNFLTFCDLFAPCFCLAHAGGRVGCNFSGCCYGMEYDGACSVYMDGAQRLPVQLMEATFLVLLAYGLLIILKKSKYRGTVAASYMLLYSTWRFIIEFFRADARGAVGTLSTSQFISLFIFVGGIALFVVSRRWRKEKAPEIVSCETTVALDAADTVEPNEPKDETVDENQPKMP